MQARSCRPRLAGLSLADKLAVTRLLMAGGATINELNCVRKHLSAIKGGRLARAAGDARVATLIISDVIDDPLDVIASGPTVADRSTVIDALRILERIAGRRSDVPEAVWTLLESNRDAPPDPPLPATIQNFVIGNNETALTAAARKAAELGYVTRSLGSRNQGEAREVGRQLAHHVGTLRNSDAAATEPVCLLAGGETTVRLVQTSQPRRGGRNQELVLGAIDSLWNDGLHDLVLLSGGTDGEDGPTDAAGAVADADLIRSAREQGLSARAVPGDQQCVRILRSHRRPDQDRTDAHQRDGCLGGPHCGVSTLAGRRSVLLSSSVRTASPPRINPPPTQVDSSTGSPHRQYTQSGFKIGSSSVSRAAS